MTPAKRHHVRLVRPAQQLDAQGQVDRSQDYVIADGVPCSIEALSGRELELARQVYPSATHKVRLFAEPGWGLQARDYLVRSEPGRRDLEIVHVKDQIGIHWELTLTCGEFAETL